MNDMPMNDSGGGAGGAVVGIIYLAVIVLMIASMWKVFAKAGQPGWAAIVPIYNIIVLLKIAGKPVWWVVLFLVPIVSLVIAILIYLGVAKSFGKGGGFAAGLILLPFVFWPMLGFGSAQYQGASS